MNSFLLLVPKSEARLNFFDQQQVQKLALLASGRHFDLIEPETQSNFAGDQPFQIQKLGASWLIYDSYVAPNFIPSFVVDQLKDPEGIFVCAGHFPISDRSLTDLGKNLLNQPEQVSVEIPPPYSLLAYNQASSLLRLQVDGLGFAHVWRLELPNAYVYSTKLHLLKAIQEFKVDELAWAARVTISWFPLEFSGFQNIQLLPAGTTVTVKSSGIGDSCEHVVTTFDAPKKWLENFDQLRPANLSVDSNIPSPQASHHKSFDSTEDLGFFVQYCSEGLDQFTKTSARLARELQAGLTGGFDSRMVISSYLKQKIPLRLRVKGAEHHTDVIVAKLLADALNLKLRIKDKAELPPPTAEELRDAIIRGGAWHFGQVYSHKFKTIFAHRSRIESGDINVLGHDGMLLRAPLHQIFRLQKYVVKDWKQTLRQFFLLPRLNLIRKKHHTDLADIFDTILDRIAKLNISEAHKIEWIYAADQGRRKNAGSLWAQPGIPVSPLMNIHNIQLAMRFPVDKMVDNFLHVEIAKANIPQWKEIEYSSWMDLRKARIQAMNDTQVLTGANPSFANSASDSADWRVGSGHHYYNRALYWNQVGADLTKSAVQKAHTSHVAEIFEMDRIQSVASEAPDDLVFVSLLEDMLK